MLVESQPKVFYFTDHYHDYPFVLIRLSKTKRAAVEPLLRRHWRALASKKAVKEFDQNHRVDKATAPCPPISNRDQDAGDRFASPTLTAVPWTSPNSSPPPFAIPSTAISCR